MRGERTASGSRCCVSDDAGPDRDLDSWRHRRTQYSALQHLYKCKQSACAHRVLDGSWESGRPLWSSNRRAACIGQLRWEILEPVTPAELKQVLTEDASSAPGLDGVKLKDVLGLEMQELCSHYNLRLLCGSQPSAVCLGRTVFLPKGSESEDLLKYHAITIASHFLWVFHKLMAHRFNAFLQLKYTQKGFRSGDSVAQHVLTLQSIIDEAKRELRPLSLAFLEVCKAFDSVSHDTIELAMHHLGCLDPFLVYIPELYTWLSMVIEYNRERSAPIFTCRGVKQGDPLSPFMFNAVIDWAFSALDKHLGFSFGNIRVNNLGYADDVALLSDTRAGLQS